MVTHISTRYCLIMVRSEKAANHVMQSVTRYIENKLGLIINAEKSKVARPRNIKYLGFGFYNKKGVNDTIRMYKKRNLEMYKIVHENPQKVHSFLIY